jgi:hypothetical protein
LSRCRPTWRLRDHPGLSTAVTDKVENLYGQAPALPADAIGPKMARLRREHHRVLGNGYCTRPH